MQYFLGTFENAMDDKNRLSIPAKMRKILAQNGETGFVISKEQAKYLKMYPSKLWMEKIGSKIKDLPHSNSKANTLRRKLGMCTAEASLDAQGRVVVPVDYCKHAGIEKKIRIIGSVDTLQLWNPSTHDEIGETYVEESFIEELQEFGI
ncbi:division/cell wall cluster transcriptional repressor MraZ [bacterium]|nr:division/cell wall cluster transcriptional repressor MraZ [bacterium]